MTLHDTTISSTWQKTEWSVAILMPTIVAAWRRRAAGLVRKAGRASGEER